jgi:hypothetical protein
VSKEFLQAHPNTEIASGFSCLHAVMLVPSMTSTPVSSAVVFILIAVTTVFHPMAIIVLWRSAAQGHTPETEQQKQAKN